jgi:hypothetical protein
VPEAFRLVFSAITDEFKVIIGRRVALQVGLWTEFVSKTDYLGVVIEAVVRQDGEHVEIIFEFLYLNGHNDFVFGRWGIEAIPKSERPSSRALSGSVGSKMRRRA